MDISLGAVATFDNPFNPQARWGEIVKIAGNKIQLSYVGWGYKEEIQVVQQTIFQESKGEKSG